MLDPSDKVSNTVPTADGTITMRDSETGELYHNSGGALREAMENYVLPARLEDILQRRKGEASSTVKLLDACFGLGYNTFALWLHVFNASHLPIDRIDVTAIELDKGVIDALPLVLEQPCFAELVDALRDQQGSTMLDNLRAFKRLGIVPESLKFNYQVREGPLYTLDLSFSDLRVQVPALSKQQAGLYDLIFHDPFSPSKVPFLWTADLFKHYFALMREESGRLLTYSAASAVRGGLEEVGFKIYRTRGVGAKQGGTLAARGHTVELVEELIFHLRGEEAERLRTASGIPYRDPEMAAETKEILRAREAEQREFKARSSG